MMEDEAKLEKMMAEDYRMVLYEAKAMGCDNIKALYNIPLKNMELIIKALEEVQQYRNHGITVESALDNMCNLAAAENLIEEYRAIGTVEELTHGKKYMNLAKRHGTIEQVIDECAEYEAIGTPEECRAAVEKRELKQVTCEAINIDKLTNKLTNALYERFHEDHQSNSTRVNLGDVIVFCKEFLNMENLQTLNLHHKEDCNKGQFLRLPCKVGDIVYIIVGKSISKQKIQTVTIALEEKIEFCTRKRRFALYDIGKRIFFTREEAEAKLKEMEGTDGEQIFMPRKADR